MSKGQKTNKSGAKPPLTGPDASNMRNELVPKIKGAVNGDTAEKREPQFRAIHDLYDETTPTRKPTEGNLERYRLVSEKAPDIIWLLRPDGQIVEVNQAAVEGYGYSREELLKMNVRDLREPSTRHLVEEQLKKAVESNARFETLHVRKDGSVFPIDVNATIWDFGGERLILSIVRDITERKKADQEYRESAILLSMAMESSRMGAWEQDRNLDVVYWTPELEEIFGLEKGAFPGTKAAFYELIDDADREEVRAKTEEAVREKRSYSVEFRFKHADGSTRWMEGRGEAVYSEKGEPVRLYGIGIDITERKQAEEALGESERRFAEFMQNLPGLAWIKDKNGRYVFVNDAAEQTFGIAKAELYGRTDDDIFPAETAVIFKENDLKALVEKAGIQTVETLKHNDGVVHHSIVNKFPIFGPDGNAGLIGGMAVDVTDQKKAEETLRLAAEFDEAVMGNMGEGLYTVDAAGVVTSMNPAAEKLLGWTFDELRGQKMHDATHYMHRDGRAFPAEECAGFQVLKTGKTLTGHEDFFIHKDGTLFDVIYSSSPIRGENGRINGLVVVFQDITERKLLEHRIAGQNEILEAVALGKPLEEILHLTTQIIEHQLPGSMCSVLLTDEGETSLSCGSAQSLPPAYNEVIDGIAIGEAKGSCGTAAFRRQTVIVQDTATDPLWKDFRDLALLHNLRSCWSHPIISQAGKLFGTFAVYFRFPREPLGVELKLLESTARIAGIAIERKEDERKTAKLAAIVTSSDDAIISKDLNGVITSWNAGAERLFGYTAQETIGKPVTLLMPPERVDEEPGILESIRNGKSIDHYETVRRRKDGSLLDVSLTVSPLFAADGSIVGASKVARDITERKRAEAALRESEALLELELADTKLLQSISSQLIHENNIDSLYEKIVDAAVGVMHSEYASMQALDPERGYNELKLLAFRGFNRQSAKFWEWVDADSQSTCGEALRTHARAIVTDVEKCDYMAGTEDLETYLQTGIHAVQSTPLVSRSGKMLGVISTHWSEPHEPAEHDLRLLDVLARQAADLIERKLAETALWESEERFRMVADNMAQLAWTCDRLGSITWYNQRWFDYTGLSFDETKGWDWSKVQHPDHIDRVVERLERSAGTGEPWEDTFPLRGKDGQYRWFLSRAVPIRDERGEIVRWFGTNTDVTERRQEQANAEFLAEISQDMVRLGGIGEIMRSVGAKIGAHFSASLCAFVEINEKEDAAVIEHEWVGADMYSVRGALRISEVVTDKFRLDAREGKQIICRDTKSDPRVDAENMAALNIRSFIGTPLLRDGEWLFMLNIYDSKPRDWRQDEIALMRELTTRIWTRLERSRAERALRESEERFGKAFNSSPLVFTISSLKDGRLIEVNDTFVNVTGYSREESLGRTTRELDVWSNAEDREQELNLLRSEGRVRDIEYPFTTRNGTEIIGLLSAEKINIGGEEFALTVIQDITERKHNELNQQFLFQINEIAREGVNPDQLLGRVAQSLGRRLNVERCLFNEIDLELQEAIVKQEYRKSEDSPSLIGRISLTSRSPITRAEIERGNALIVDDILTDARTADYSAAFKDLGIVSYIAVPLMRNGKWTATLLVTSETPRRWNQWEANLVQTVAERTWLSVEKLRSDNALQESEESYRTLFDLVPVAVYACDANGVITEYNQNAATLWGREPEPGELYCGSMKIYYPDGQPMSHDTCPMAKIIKGEVVPPEECEILVERPDGARKIVFAIPKVLKDENGNVTGAINCLYDVTETKLAQRALIRAERKAADEYQGLLARIVPLGQTLGTARDLIAIYRAVHEFICSSMGCSGFFVSFYSSQTKLRTAAYAWGEGEEIDITLLPPMPITPDGGSNSQAILNKKTVITNRYWDTMKDRPHVVLQENGVDPMSSLVVPMMVKNQVTGTLEVQAHEDEAFSRDHVIVLEMVANLAAVAIENVRLLKIEANAREAAESANRTKDEFLAVLSHELRTPLNSMMGWIRMLRHGDLDSEHTAKALEVIERNTRMQSSLIEDLLDVSRIISGKMRIEKELIDLLAAVRAATGAIRPMAAAKNISFEIDAGDEPLFTDGDPVRLQQMATNLLQNAVKFTPEYGSVGVTVRQSGSDAVMEFRDSGIGIDGELLPYIFDRFQQGDASTKRGFAGLGLGLTIVRTIVNLHGGEIKVDSDGKDRGALFTIRLPLSEILYAEKTEADGDGNGKAADYALEGIRILLVDDDSDSVRPLALFLECQKAKVVTAGSAAAALQKLADGQFDVLITDIGMPGMDGFELLAEIRGNGSTLPAIAVTAYASPDDYDRAIASGFQAHLAKPVDFDKLLATVKELRTKQFPASSISAL